MLSLWKNKQPIKVYVIIPSVSAFKKDTQPDDAFFKRLDLRIFESTRNMPKESPVAFIDESKAQEYLAINGGYDSNLMAVVEIPPRKYVKFKAGKETKKITSDTEKQFEAGWVVEVTYILDTKELQTTKNPLKDDLEKSRTRIASKNNPQANLW